MSNKPMNNNKQKREDNKLSLNIDHNERFQEKKLDFYNKKTGMDFDNLIDSEYPKEYISKLHDNDINKILSVNDFMIPETHKNNINYDNFKLLLELMKNKKAALYEKNFYMDEYSTDFDKIKGIDNTRSQDENNIIDYLDQFKNLLPFKSDNKNSL